MLILLEQGYMEWLLSHVGDGAIVDQQLIQRRINSPEERNIVSR